MKYLLSIVYILSALSAQVSIGVPSIMNFWGPQPNSPISIQVDISSSSDIDFVRLNFSVNGGSYTDVDMSIHPEIMGRYIGQVPSQPAWSLIYFNILAQNVDGDNSTSPTYEFSIYGVSNVFISEYAEGSSYNKYIEIYNGSDEDIDLSEYQLWRIANGGTWAEGQSNAVNLEGILESGDVFVVCNSQADDFIQSNSDLIGTDITFYNGDDAIGLAYGGFLIDVVGASGDDPGSGWDVAGIPNATAEHTLVRKSNIETGNRDWESSSGTNETNSEWIVFSQNTWDYIGSHGQKPTVEIESYPELFIEGAEVTIIASATSPVGEITSMSVYYGLSYPIENQISLSLNDQNKWESTFNHGMDGNVLILLKVCAMNSFGTEGCSEIIQNPVASLTPNLIADLYSNESNGELVTIEGIVTIGTGPIYNDTHNKAIVQDESGRGMMLRKFQLTYGLNEFERGDKVLAAGFTSDTIYNSTTSCFHLKDFNYTIISENNELPPPIIVSPLEMNSPLYEGTLIKTTGNITAKSMIDYMLWGFNGYSYDIENASKVVIWNGSMINTTNLEPGYFGQFTGVGTYIKDFDDFTEKEFHLLVGYEADISPGTPDSCESGYVPLFGNCYSIVETDSINLSGQSLTSSISSDIGQLINLKYIDLSDNHISGIIPNTIGQLDHLEYLDFSANNLIGELPLEFSSLSNLKTLILSNNQLTGLIPSNITDLESIEHLDLSMNEFYGQIPPQIGVLDELVLLGLYGNEFDGIIPESITDLLNLQYLLLHNNSLGGSIPNELGNLTQMKILSLWGNYLNGPIPESIGSLTQLRELYLNNNMLNEDIPSQLFNIVSLEKLYVSDNQLSGEIPSELGNLINLEHLYLWNNQFTGTFPQGIGNLTNLTQLNIGMNQFSGDIPNQIGNLTSLNKLYLLNNQFSGSIPSTIGNLVNLNYLFLSANQLGGTIPEEICELNITWEGADEEGDPFYSFEGNKLCSPYPSCIINIGYQDTSNCAFASTFTDLIPFSYNLSDAYPNPFNPSTKISYELPKSEFVRLIIYDIMGREIKQLVNTVQQAGYKSITWDATNNLNQQVSPGMYIYTIHAGAFVQSKKVILLK